MAEMCECHFEVNMVAYGAAIGACGVSRQLSAGKKGEQWTQASGLLSELCRCGPAPDAATCSAAVSAYKKEHRGKEPRGRAAAAWPLEGSTVDGGGATRCAAETHSRCGST
uniref:Uncharacterized protein n=1 Tax=Pyrodinium bahamense TaxID=73915 RepID=A0A7R9ZXD6_9DINO|mmetsp:Transcript_1291/g.3517  ORF Transcript_1291/g.3517 Transcript_1291/m.3517 type:complete len:111 (+) Transcript_1291:192-524(+)